jgi:hypothetical protein
MQYQLSLEKNVPIEQEERAISLILRKFNELPASKQASILDISYKEIAALSENEQRALIDLLITKLSRLPNRVSNEDSLKDIRKKLMKSVACSSDDYREIAATFQKYLTGREKSAIRKLMHEQVVTPTVSKEALVESIQKLDEEIKTRSKKLEGRV